MAMTEIDRQWESFQEIVFLATTDTGSQQQSLQLHQAVALGTPHSRVTARTPLRNLT